MGETNSTSVAYVGYDIYPLSRVEKYCNPRATEGESKYMCCIKHLHLQCTFHNEEILRFFLQSVHFFITYIVFYHDV